MSDAWYCCMCNEEIPRNVVVYRLRCIGKCKKFFHIKCLNMSKDDYFDIKKQGSLWYCGKCEEPGAEEEEESCEDVVDYPEGMEALVINSIDYCIDENGPAHHTERFELMRRNGDSMLVIRRGQSFKLRLNCSRPFNPDIDDMCLIMKIEDVSNPVYGNGTMVGVAVREDSNELGDPSQWAAAIESINDNELEIVIRSASTASVTRWMLDIDSRLFTGETQTYNHPQPFYILFNPWCPEDIVYMEDQSLLNEYILEDTTLIWRGSYNRMRRTVWKVGQFERNVLDAAFFVVSGPGKVTAPLRGDPIKVTRALSAAVNSVDDDGVVHGNWTEEFPDGTPPTQWIGSAEILQKYLETKIPVNYGQCWVFSGVLATICRAIGIPTRVVTNYSSAHDTQASLTVDYFIDSNGCVIEDMNTDSIWNYHVWNEVWMERPDLGTGPSGSYGGWQAIDATPQEMSDGMYRCGPASVAAVRLGEVDRYYDTSFLYAEVNADKVYWKFSGPSQPYKLLKKDILAIGQFISTKAIGAFEREDITDTYKFAENTADERSTMIKALKQTNHAFSRFYLNEEFNDVYFNFELLDDIKIGENFKVRFNLTNRSPDTPYTISGSLHVETVHYTGRRRQNVKSENFEHYIEPGSLESVEMEVTFDEYYKLLFDQCAFNVSCMASVRDTGYEYFAQDAFRVRQPDIQISFYTDPILHQEIDGVAYFENPLPMSLTGGVFTIEGPGLDEAIIVEIEESHAGESPTAYFKYKPIFLGESSLVAKFLSNELKDVDGFCKFTTTS